LKPHSFGVGTAKAGGREYLALPDMKSQEPQIGERFRNDDAAADRGSLQARPRFSHRSLSLERTTESFAAKTGDYGGRSISG